MPSFEIQVDILKGFESFQQGLSYKFGGGGSDISVENFP